jgi:hypothetical protein
VVPYVVDAARVPLDFRALDPDHVRRCAKHRRCAICGSRIDHGKPVALIGPDDGRQCYADPWMHPACAELAMGQCPFLAGRRGWRDGEVPLVSSYTRNMVLRVVQEAEAHLESGVWHFRVVTP